MEQYLDMFLSESAEHLAAMGDHLMSLEEDPRNLQLVNEIFRSAHTLKGMSATMGFEDVSTLTHRMENVLDLLRNQKLEATSEVVDLLFQCMNRLEEMVRSIEEGGSGKSDVSALVQQLEHFAQAAPAEAPASAAVVPTVDMGPFERPEVTPSLQMVLEEAREQGHTPWEIGVRLQPDAALKGVRAFMIFQQLEQMGEIVASYPDAEELQEERFEDRFVIWFVGREKEEQIHRALLQISDVEEILVAPLSVGPDSSKLPKDGEAQPTAKEEGQQSQSGQRKSRTLRIDVEKIDRLMNLMSELAIDRSRLQLLSTGLGDAKLLETMEHFQRLMSEFQDVVFGLRMVPVNLLFNRFPRMVRDLSKDLGKQVQFEMLGLETELDRTIMDEISDLLVHLIRNSIDHGIETMEVRRRQNKDETGKLVISAFQSGNSVMIEVTDDGGGIDRDRVLKKAMERELITSAEAARMSDSEVFGMLMMPGFSTAEKVTDISGRGVGLDAVKSKIESLGGSVTISSRLGEGSTFTLQLPLTLSIIQSLMIQLADEQYAVPINAIVETQSIPAEQVISLHHQRMVRVRDRVVPLIDLRQIIGLPSKDDERDISFVVIHKGDHWAALQVDSFLGEQEVVVKSLGKYLGEVFPFSGATILGDGHVALILDSLSLIHS